MEWFYIIGIGLICILSPVLLLMWLTQLPCLASIIYIAWITLSVGSIAFSKKEKWYERMYITFFITSIFTIVFIYFINNSDSDMFGDPLLFMEIFVPFACLPLMYLIGNCLHSIVDKKRVHKQQKKKDEICNKIRQLEVDIQYLNGQVQDRENIVHLLLLLECCNIDVSDFKSNPIIQNISLLEEQIDQKHNEIKILTETLSN